MDVHGTPCLNHPQIHVQRTEAWPFGANGWPKHGTAADDGSMAGLHTPFNWSGIVRRCLEPNGGRVMMVMMVMSCHRSRSPRSPRIRGEAPVELCLLGEKKLADSYRFVQRHLSGIKSVLWFFEKLENHRLWMRFKLPLYFLFQHLQMFVPSNSLRSQPKAVQNHGRSASRLTLADHSSEACCWTEILHLYLDPKILGIPTR